MHYEHLLTERNNLRNPLRVCFRLRLSSCAGTRRVLALLGRDGGASRSGHVILLELTCLPAEAASRRICEARGWIVRLRLAGHWLL